VRTLLTIPRGKLASLSIDLQEEHRQDQRYLVDAYDGVLANAARLQQAARARGVPVLHCVYVVDTDAARLRPFHPVMADGSSAFSDKSSPLSAICPEVAPLDGEPVLVKTDASAFSEGSLQARLETGAIEWLCIAGVWTEACIDATVKDAMRWGIRVLLVKDACSSATPAMHQTGILNLANRLYGGAVTDTDGACRLIGGETVDVWAVEGSVPIRFSFASAAADYDQL
jgi:maleamate amidohydrolase